MIKKHFLSDDEMKKLSLKDIDISDAWLEHESSLFSYTFDDVTDKLPVNISLDVDELSYQLNMWFDEDDETGRLFYVAYLPDNGTDEDIELHYEVDEAPINAVYNMLLWLIDNGYIKC